MMPRALCPDCDEEIVLNRVIVGQTVTCPHCDADLQVINVDPLELDWAYAWNWEEEEEGEESDY
jgi:alpha-aminoadipate carrier protein LysW